MKVPIRLTLITLWKISRSCGPCLPAVRCAQPMPAQQTEIRRPPSAPAAASTAAWTGSGSITFASTKPARSPSSPASASPFSALRSAITTRGAAPRAGRARSRPRGRRPRRRPARLRPRSASARQHIGPRRASGVPWVAADGTSVACFHRGAGSSSAPGRGRRATWRRLVGDPPAARAAVRRASSTASTRRSSARSPGTSATSRTSRSCGWCRRSAAASRCMVSSAGSTTRSRTRARPGASCRSCAATIFAPTWRTSASERSRCSTGSTSELGRGPAAGRTGSSTSC